MMWLEFEFSDALCLVFDKDPNCTKVSTSAELNQIYQVQNSSQFMEKYLDRVCNPSTSLKIYKQHIKAFQYLCLLNFLFEIVLITMMLTDPHQKPISLAQVFEHAKSRI